MSLFKDGEFQSLYSRMTQMDRPDIDRIKLLIHNGRRLPVFDENVEQLDSCVLYIEYLETILDSLNSNLTSEQEEIATTLLRDGWAAGNYQDLLTAARRLTT